MTPHRKTLKNTSVPTSNHNKKLNLDKYSEIVTPVHQQAVQSGMVAEVDLRTKRGRTMLMAYGEYVSDKGGEDRMSFAEKELARRCATLAMVAAGLEEKLVETSVLNEDALAQYIVTSRTLTSLLRILGTDRRPRDITSISIKDYQEQVD